MDSLMQEFLDAVDSCVRKIYSNAEEKLPTEQEVRETYQQYFDAMSSMPMYSEIDLDLAHTEVDKLTERYLEQQEISKPVGVKFKDEKIRPWLNAFVQKNNLEWFYWDRYKKYLIDDKKWAPQVVSVLSTDTYEILDLMADPNQAEPFERKGLVMASVQSGKTSNYTGLICRAADMGYKIIIVMAGVHNMLRNQTQKRLEEGFAGFNIIDGSDVGAGLSDNSKRPMVCTSRQADFNKARAEGCKGRQSKNANAPWLFVIKKNSNALRQVYDWLTTNGTPEEPLLLIDDEADNASINGKYRRNRRTANSDSSAEEVTKINGQIRKILEFFTKKVYIGYTATPFANILIDPNIQLEEFGADLFPKSFIYTLGESSDYFGAEKVFGDYDSSNPKYLRFIEDGEELLPTKHQSDFQVSGLPTSLKQAIQTFVVATAIRYLRGDQQEHSTMMVNVSPYVSVQNLVFYLITDYVQALRNAAKSWGSLNTEEATAHSPYILQMKKTWECEYRDGTEFEWQKVQETLYDVLATIQVQIINSRSGEVLDYEEEAQHVIAIGGYRLSRGLTLEGLIVSYYKRNSKAYDTLMQMARWFGYRPGYEDLCRIWMTDEAAGWYKFVTEATEDLEDQVLLMKQQGKNPNNFVLGIWQHPDSLIITARNKMGLGQRAVKIDYNNSFIETVAILSDQESFEANRAAACDLAKHITDHGEELKPYRKSGGYLAHNVPASTVEEFLRAYQNCTVQSPQTDTDAVCEYIDRRRDDGELLTWDVLFMSGGEEAKEPNRKFLIDENKSLKWERRKPGDNSRSDYYLVGEKRRVSGRGVAQAGLTKKQTLEAEVEYVEKRGHVKNCSDRFYNRHRTTPLLVIHPILFKFDPKAKKGTYDGSRLKDTSLWPDKDYECMAIGWTIAFPSSKKENAPIEHVFNVGVGEEIAKEFREESDDNYEDDYDEDWKISLGSNRQ